MVFSYYRLLPGLAASLCLLVAACGSTRTDPDAPPPPAAAPQPAASASEPREIDTESTIWTILGIAKKPQELQQGPQTGPQVSPILWQAAHDALDFVKITSEDADSGTLQTDWYSPPGKPNERLRISVFILSRALRSDSVTVTIDRQTRAAAGGPWQAGTIAREAVSDLETAILLRARQIHAERYRSAM